MYLRLCLIIRCFSRTTMDAAKPKQPQPKKFGNTDTLRHVKLREKMKGKLPVSGVISLQICGTGGYDCPRSIILSTDHNKYLFNCGEGTQRLINEHKLKAARLEHIFITHKSWENVGGMLGMALTLQAVNVPLVKIQGPPEVEKAVLMSRNFADMKAAGIQKVEVGEEQISDHTFRIEPVVLRPGKTAESASKRLRLDYEKDLAVAYICRPKPYPRKVDLAKCIDLGIKSGPVLGRLKSGEVVTLEDGREIHPDQILGEQLPSKPILIVQLPRIDYLNSLLNCESIKQLQDSKKSISENSELNHGSSETEDGEAEIVVHLSDTDTVNEEKYQHWMNSFSPSTKHLIFDALASGANYRSPYRCQAMLNQIHPGIFPLLKLQQGQNSDSNWRRSLDDNRVKVTSNLVYNYRPRKQFDTNGVVNLDNDEYIEESQSQPEFPEKLRELKSQLAEIQGAYKECTYPHIVFLGTGSSVPSNTRNVSGILLHLDADSCLLLDCGEGTLGQIWRFYGNDTRKILKNLKGILISHLHADHHLGVFTILLERHKLYGDETWYEPLDIVGPANYKKWANSFLCDFLRVEDCMKHHENHTFLPERLEHCNESHRQVTDRMCLESLVSVSVKHCKGSFGFVLKLKDGKKVTYSGDTMPCEELVRAGEGSHLLIHEATMENDLVEEARRKTHSTTSEAISVGRQMKADFTLLTHFSQRYAKIPVFGDEFTDNVGIAFDNMRVDFDQLKLLPLFVPALKALFAEHYAELEANIEKRQLRARALEIAARSIEKRQAEAVLSESQS